jgi:bla regulator protein BlaR1
MNLGTLSDLWTSVAPQMANHLWQSTLFLVLAATLAFSLRKNQARIRYWVWLTASMKFLLPFSLLIVLGSHLAKPRTSTPVQAVVYSAVENFSQPFVGPDLPSLSQTPAPVSRFHLLPPIAVAAWLAGIVFVLLVWAAGWIRVSRMVRRALPLERGPEFEALRRLESSFGIRRPIGLVLSQDSMEPGIFGIFRPILIWPEGISKHLDERHIDAILAHEICHARRHDNLTAVLHMLVEAVFWFHPLVWWMGARLEEERERACDEEVSLQCNRPDVYAESILRVCKFCSESPLACVAGITGADLKKRIVQIMTERVVPKLTRAKKLLLATVTVCVLAAPVVLGMVRMSRAFDVISIRLSPPDERNHSGITRTGYDMGGLPIAAVIADAFFPRNWNGRIRNAPDWVMKDHFDIMAKVGPDDIDEWQKEWRRLSRPLKDEMLQNLLAERLKFIAHLVPSEADGYALVLDKKGSKLVEAPPDEPRPDNGGPLPGGGYVRIQRDKDLRYSFQGVTMAAFAQFLVGLGGDQVADQTGLTGKYDFTLTWLPAGPDEQEQDVGVIHFDDPDRLSHWNFGALGLRAQHAKLPTQDVVIDHIERPTPN